MLTLWFDYGHVAMYILSPSLPPSLPASLPPSPPPSLPPPRLLTLWFDYGHYPDVHDAVTDGLKTIDIDTWLQVCVCVCVCVYCVCENVCV